MSVEGGLSVGGLGGGGVGAGVSRGGFEKSGPGVFGPEVKRLSSPLISEGPVARSFLENSMTLAIGRLDPVQSGGVFVEDLSVQAAIAEAESIIAQAQNPLKESNSVVEMKQPEYKLPSWQGIIPQTEPRVAPMAVPNKLEYPSPGVFFYPVPEPATKTESTTQQAQTLIIPEAIKAEEQVVEELVEEKVRKDTKDSPEEEETRQSVRYLEDGQASGQRRHEIREAILKAAVEADRLGLTKIAGWLVAKFMPAEHVGNRSQVMKNSGPDGSYQETVEAIAAVGELESNEKAAEKLNKIVVEKKPVKYGKDGTPVAQADVARVYKYKSVIKPSSEAYETVYKRVIKKKDKITSDNTPAQVSLNNQSKPETSLKDYPALEEVFQKAA